MIDGYTLIGLSLSWTAAIVGILCWSLITSKGHWIVKAGTTLLVFALAFSTIYVWRELQGTPKVNVDLEGYVVKAYLIKEPKNGNKGRIWLWVTQPGSSEPMSVTIPYTKNTHKMLTENKGLREGVEQKLKKKPKSEGKGDSNNNSEGDEYELQNHEVRNTIKI